MAGFIDVGKDVQLKQDASRILYEASKKTWKFRKNQNGEVFSDYDSLSGLRYSNLTGMNDFIFGMNSDGIGTKVDIAERLNKHDTIAFDLIAMVADDAVSEGAEPMHVSTVLDFNKISLNIVRQLAKGLIDACEAAEIAAINGEIAELGNRLQGYSEYAYNWSATLSWAANRERLISGKAISEGQSVVALREFGFRSNGFTLIRKILTDAYGEKWHENKEANKLAEQLLLPSKIYTPTVLEMVGRFGSEPKVLVSGIAHITGGGIPLKLGRTLKPSGCGAELNELFEPSDIMLTIQKKGKVEDAAAYSTWNMGSGMLIITDQPKVAISIARQHNIEAKEVGRITRQRKITIKSKGAFSKGKKLEFSV
jgi:phosphoribosylformylglycinamidine cyclo-ligase